MKLLHLSFRFEFTDRIEVLLDRHNVRHFVRYPMVEGKDRDGKHFGGKVFPGSVSVVQAQVEDEKVEGLLEDLRSFREEKKAHRHVEALILPVERRLS